MQVDPGGFRNAPLQTLRKFDQINKVAPSQKKTRGIALQY